MRDDDDNKHKHGEDEAVPEEELLKEALEDEDEDEVEPEALLDDERAWE